MTQLYKFITLFLISGFLFSADSINNAEYTFSMDRADIRAGETIVIHADINIKEGFYTYSSHPDLTLTPSYFEWIDTTLFSVLGIMNEPKPIIKFVEAFKMDVGKHINSVVLSQEIVLANNAQPGQHILEGTFIYQVCDSCIL